MRRRATAMPKPPRRTAVVDRPVDRSPARSADWARFDRLGRFLAAVCALCAVASLPNSSAFALTSVSVRGNAALPTGEALERLGVRPGDSAFRVNAFEIRRRLLEDPRVADAAVALSFPHALVVSVRERDPVAALVLPNGYVEIGGDGVAISRAATPGRGLRLEVQPLALPWLQLGTAVPSDDVRFGAAVAAGLSPVLRSQVMAVRVEAGELILETRDGTWVKAGGPDGLDERLALAPRVLAAVRARGIRARYVDLRVPGNIIVLPAAPATPLGAAAAATGTPAATRSVPATASSAAPGQENPPHR
ncbi:MAG TPA: FtsQ-type POTRA domain-containing protein [bacterium]|nr:FtsQ-type POTRA domain-containing protein [bacterium]